MMLFQDGSSHAWLEGQPALDLIVTLDDATSEIYSAFLVEEEGTQSSFRGLGEVIGRHGLFSSLYSDRGSHYFVTPKAGGKVAKVQPTQVGRALAQLGIEHIPSYSPEARGRMERVFGTLQSRLPQSCGWPGSPPPRGRTVFSPSASWRRTTPASRWRRPSPAARSCRLRVIWPRSCASRPSGWWATTTACATAKLSLQIPAQRHRHHFVKVKVRVHAYADGRLAVFHGPRCLARYEACGRLTEAPEAARNFTQRRHPGALCVLVAHRSVSPTAISIVIASASY
jgi:hypothetical protein